MTGDWNCKECNHTEDECKDCYPELGYKNSKLKRDTEAVEKFVKSDFFKDLMESLDETREFCEITVKALEKEPCEDAISREDALMCLTGEIKDTDTIETIIARFVRRIRNLPPVTPQAKTGHWIEEIDDYGKVIGWHCDKCYEDSGFTTDCKWDFCPNCGAKMVELQEGKG